MDPLTYVVKSQDELALSTQRAKSANSDLSPQNAGFARAAICSHLSRIAHQSWSTNDVHCRTYLQSLQKPLYPQPPNQYTRSKTTNAQLVPSQRAAVACPAASTLHTVRPTAGSNGGPAPRGSRRGCMDAGKIGMPEKLDETAPGACERTRRRVARRCKDLKRRRTTWWAGSRADWAAAARVGSRLRSAAERHGCTGDTALALAASSGAQHQDGDLHRCCVWLHQSSRISGSGARAAKKAGAVRRRRRASPHPQRPPRVRQRVGGAGLRQGPPRLTLTAAAAIQPCAGRVLALTAEAAR